MPSLASSSSSRRCSIRAPGAALCLVMLAICAAMPASAAKVYRCGNVFQDQPCPEVKIAAATPVERPLEVARSSTRDMPCAMRDGRNECVAKSAAPRDVPADIRR